MHKLLKVSATAVGNNAAATGNNSVAVGYTALADQEKR